jgi:molecular chaperone DnaK (HSP70)
MNYPLAIDVGTATTTAATWRGGGPVTLALVQGADDHGSGGPGSGTAPSAGPEPVIGLVVGEATRLLGGPPGRLLLTAPTWWPAGRRDLLRQSGSAAGVTDVRVLPATIAAAAYHCSGAPLDPGAAVAVYDLGAGGFDAAVLVRTRQGFELCAEPVGEDRASTHRVGGDAFDRVLAGIIGRELPGTDPAAARTVAPAVKVALSAHDVVDLSSWFPAAAPTRLTRDRFEDAIRGDVAATVDRLRQAMRDAEIDPRMLAAVLLAGDSSRIPLVADLVRAGLGVSPQLLDRPKLGVCLGAVIIDAWSSSGPVSPAAHGSPGDRVDPGRGAPSMDLPLRPAGIHWARRPAPISAAPDDPTVIVRLDDHPIGNRGLLLRLLLLALAAAALVIVAILLADLR